MLPTASAEGTVCVYCPPSVLDRYSEYRHNAVTHSTLGRGVGWLCLHLSGRVSCARQKEKESRTLQRSWLINGDPFSTSMVVSSINYLDSDYLRISQNKNLGEIKIRRSRTTTRIPVPILTFLRTLLDALVKNIMVV
jgi:hypothetical protein